jgi:hypothetical protein
VFDCWRRFVQFVSGSFQPSMIRKESKKLARQPTELVIQSTTRSLQMGLNRSKYSM